ncbi:DUF6327 family protein [Mesonia ostreae]|uniref:DUF6327 family protein n=1 Tax=Mesonia ostreae TaxID=861110 RepID=A0ABU2KJ56_9FLAO|nr:DUF6327 family protein [Mesonia ostreae]MDT0294683.1 DUF6327 family protein [Mesonia ostreae]
MKIYNSYEEVDHDLKILKLQTEINKEKMKINVEDIKEDLSPISIVSGIVSSIAKKAFILKAVGKILGSSKPNVLKR